jgi:hypothetical protein
LPCQNPAADAEGDLPAGALLSPPY